MTKRVNFDFEGSLRLARKLAALADNLESSAGNRDSDYETARAEWRGAYAPKFDSRRSSERTKETNAINQLRGEADVWAQAWAGAMHQQNLYNRGEYIKQLADQKRDERGWFETGTDWIGFTNDTSLEEANNEVPVPEPPPVPTAQSNYAATATEKQYP